MAKAIIARQDGDRYQALLFWYYLAQLRTNDFIDSVCLESDNIRFIDDLMVHYCVEQKEKSTGSYYVSDYFQCKYHITQGGAFTFKNLIDPKFIGNKESILLRLYNAYTRLSAKSDKFRLIIFSNWSWDPHDELAEYLQEEFIRSTFYEKGPTSSRGKMRTAFAKHLNIDEEQLQLFLNKVRFRLGRNLTQLTEDLHPILKLAGLKPISSTETCIIYDDLAWELFKQGKNVFNKDSLEKMLNEENLIAETNPGSSEVSIASFKLYAHRPREILAAHLDLTRLFKGRFPMKKNVWKKEIRQCIDDFIHGKQLQNLPQPLHLFFDCHLSIAFFVGSLISPRFRITIVPAQIKRSSDFEFWNPPNNHITERLWDIKSSGKIKEEVVIGISVSNPIENHLRPFLKAVKLNRLPQILASPVEGFGQTVIRDGNHAWYLGHELRDILRETIPDTCKKIHLFYSGPVALAYILGNSLQNIAKQIQLYEYDFEGKTYLRYYPSILIKN